MRHDDDQQRFSEGEEQIERENIENAKRREKEDWRWVGGGGKDGYGIIGSKRVRWSGLI